MKGRAPWIFAVVAALALAAVLWWRSPGPSSPTGNTAVQIPGARPVPPPAPAVTATASAGTSVLPSPAAPAPAAARVATEVPIQDGKTIDFSSGVPVVKDDAKEKAAIDRAVKAMDDAAKDVTFGPPAAKKN